MELEPIDQLIVQALQGRATPPEERQLAAWRAADPANERRYQEVLAVWAALERGRTDVDTGRPPASRVISAAGERARPVARDDDGRSRASDAPTRAALGPTVQGRL